MKLHLQKLGQLNSAQADIESQYTKHRSILSIVKEHTIF